MKQVLALIAAGSMLAACQAQDDRIAFDGKYFRAKVGRVDGKIDTFVVSVKPVSASLEGAREAGRYEAITYCVTNFGNSDINWLAGPDAPATGLVIQNDTLVLQGTCPQR